MGVNSSPASWRGCSPTIEAAPPSPTIRLPPMSLSELPVATVSPADFQRRLLHFITETLPRLDRRGRICPQIDAGTPLFANGLLDSLSILHLIAAIEELTGRRVPDEQVVMKHFQTVEAITTAFCPLLQ